MDPSSLISLLSSSHGDSHMMMNCSSMMDMMMMMNCSMNMMSCDDMNKCMPMDMSMPMYFYASTSAQVLFEFWNVDGIPAYIGSLAIIFVFALFNEYVVTWASNLEYAAFSGSHHAGSGGEHSPLLEGDPRFGSAVK